MRSGKLSSRWLKSADPCLKLAQMSDLTLEELKNAAPKGGFFADREWIWSPEPFELSKSQKKLITRLGHPL